MLRFLLRKQFREVFRGYFVNAKTGAVRSAGSIAGMFILFGFLMTVVAGTFFAVGFGLAVSFFEIGYGWLFYAIMAILATALGLFGSVFNTYSILYLPKDNELLLSMPIPPSKILLSRFSVVYLLSLLYSQIVWIPGIVAGLIFGHAYQSAAGIVFSIVSGPILSLFVSVLTCLCGFVVAAIASRLKKKSILTVIISLAFFALYMFVVNKFSDVITAIIDHADAVGAKVGVWGFFFTWLGKGCMGEILPFLFFAAFSAVTAALCFFILSRTFISLTTRKVSAGKAKEKAGDSRIRSLDGTLLRREAKRFLSSPTYMLNAGVGLILLPLATVLLCVRSGVIRSILGELDGYFANLAGGVSVLAVVVCAFVLGMNMISTPSVSLEGNRLWILRSFPIPTEKVLLAKLRFHVYMNAPAGVVCSVLLTLFLGRPWYDAVLTALCVCAYVWFSGVYGLLLGLRFPNLNWTNEATVVKQGAAVMIGLFSQWLGILLIGGTLFCLCVFLPAAIPLTVFLLGFGLASFLLTKKLLSSGVDRFEAL